MSDDTPTEARPASGEHNANTAPAEAAGNQPESPKRASGDGRTGSGGGAPRRRRRRGSRGGRNRRKPAKTAAAPDGAAAKDPAEAGEDYTDAAADRGLTTEDVAADARVEAGLEDAEPGAVTGADASSSAKPKIGDTRPAPPSGDATPTRRGDASSSTTSARSSPTTPRSTATSTWARCRTSCPGWKRRSSTSAPRRTVSCTAATSPSTPTTSRRATLGSSGCSRTVSRCSSRSRRTRSGRRAPGSPRR